MSVDSHEEAIPARRSKKNRSSSKPPKCKPIDLALQGGGAHGAFTWGVLDKLLDDGRVEIEAISGTSAGAMNAAVLADGMVKGGREGAREALVEFWGAVSRAARASPIQRSFWDVVTGNWGLDYSPGYLFVDLLSRLASPYELNPLNMNPLRNLVAQQVDFDRVRRCDRIKLFVSATNVKTGRVKVFNHEELSLDAIMASACLPFLFQAVEIDGEAYWDGGYMGNPVLFPFIYKCVTRDIVIVQINPLERDRMPTTAREILNRVNEITFNASLMKEFRAIEFVSRLLDEGSLDHKRYKRMLIHLIEGEDQLEPLGASSKLNAEWAFLRHLHDIGREAASDWLNRSYDKIGTQSTADLRSLFS
jgi:NTE family protein